MNNIPQNFDELEMVAEKTGELSDRVQKIETEFGAQTKTLESAALVLDAAIKGLGAIKNQVLENDIGALQLALNDKTAHLAAEIGRFEAAVAEIDRRAESGDAEIRAALLATAQSLRAQFEAKSADVSEWGAKVEASLKEHAIALAAIPPVIKGADAVGFNPVGEWEQGRTFARMDVVSHLGSSYISNEDGNTEKPSKSKKYTVLAKRAGSVAMGGVGDFAGLNGVTTPPQIASGVAAWAVGDVLYANTTGTLTNLAAGTLGHFLQSQGAASAPAWAAPSGAGLGDFSGPASATDNAVVRFDLTTGKIGQNSAVTIADTTGAVTITGTGGYIGASLTAQASTDLTLAGAATSKNVNITLNGSGRVGIGTASPSARVTITSPTALDTHFGLGANEDNYLTVGAAGSQIFRRSGTTDLSINGSGVVSIPGATASTSTTTGALQVAGGVGIGGNIHAGGYIAAGGAVSGVLTGDVTASRSATTGAIFLGTDGGQYIYRNGATTNIATTILAVTGGGTFGAATAATTSAGAFRVGALTGSDYVNIGGGKIFTGSDVTVGGDLFVSKSSGDATVQATTSDSAGLSYLRLKNSAASGPQFDWRVYGNTHATTALRGFLVLSDVLAGTNPITVAPTTGLVTLAGNLTVSGVRIVSTDTISGAGAVSVTKDTTKITSTGVGDALTLADGVDGQIKCLIHDVDGGSAVLTPATKTGFSTITFTNVGESAVLEFVTTRGWIIRSLYLAVAA